jgi:hypothetical protein
MGGNVFQGTSDFDHSAIEEILKTVNNSLAGTGIEAIPVGSAATPTPGKRSGDLDVIVDLQAVMDYFDVRDPKAGRKMLNDYISQKGFDTAQSGTNVHVRAPVGNSSAQVDIMVVANAPTVAQFHTHNIPAGSPYKGLHKQLALSKLAKSKNMLWSAWKGLFARNEAGKAGEFISDNLDEIAKALLNDSASAKDLGSLEAILAALPQDQADALLADLETDPNWTVVKTESLADKNHNRIVELMKAMSSR